MAQVLARNWWALALRGVFGILFGLVAFLLPGMTLGVLILLFGVYAVADGVFAIVAGIRAAEHHERWGALMIEGIAAAIRLRRTIRGEWLLGLNGALSVLFGFLLMAMPLIGFLTLVWLVGGYALVFGILLLGLAFRLRKHPVRVAPR